MPTVMTAAAMATVTAVTDQLYAGAGSRSYIFFVEDVERCQTNVCDFFLTEEDLIATSVA